MLILCVLALSRFIPHPPNFTSLLALSFYVPAIFGLRYLPVLLISFAITDFVIGYHTLTFFTWGSVFVIGLIAQLFKKLCYGEFLCIVWSINFFCSNKFWCLGNWNVRFRSSRNKNNISTSNTIFRL